MNRRTFLKRASGAAGVAGVASCTRSAQRLNVYNWSDYVAPETIPNFEREFGVRVRYGTYESNEEMLAKVMGGNSGWDVVFPSQEFIRPMQAMGLLARLDHNMLGNLPSLAPAFRQPPWDNELTFSVPYMHGTTGIAYQKSLSSAPRRWADLWDPSLRGKITMLDDAGDVLGASLEKLGLSFNSSNPDELRRAASEAIAQKPLVRAYINAEVRDQLVAGDVAAAQVWSVTAGQAIAVSNRVAYVLPAEGFGLWADSVSILRESGRIGLAHAFLNYLLRPEVAASIVRTTRTATANGEARRLLAPELREDPVLYAPDTVLARGEWIEPPSPASQRLRDRLWTEIKSS
jgi:spermidine/putrescine transport system substrate-binding protein